jgi:hypothetical protein
MHVAAKPVELGYHYCTAALPRLDECCFKLWPPFQSVRALASLDLDEHAHERASLGRSEPLDSLALRLKT